MSTCVHADNKKKCLFFYHDLPCSCGVGYMELNLKDYGQAVLLLNACICVCVCVCARMFAQINRAGITPLSLSPTALKDKVEKTDLQPDI